MSTTAREESLRAEALALFQVNQTSRAAAERVAALLISAIAVLMAAGVAAKTDDVAIAFPPVALVLLSYMFQMYADVSVTGAARRHIETELRKRGDDGLMYEHLVAPIRKTRPLVSSIRVLQGTTGTMLLGACGYAAYVAFDGQRWYVSTAFGIVTVLALSSAVMSYLAMDRAFGTAEKALTEDAGGNEPDALDRAARVDVASTRATVPAHPVAPS